MVWCSTKKLCTRRSACVGALSWWSCQSPIAHRCGLLNHLNRFWGGMFKLNAKFDADLLLYLLSHFECDSHTIHMLTQWHVPFHWQIQWNCHCSHVCIPVHSPWLPGYIDVIQTVLITLTATGLSWTDLIYTHIHSIHKTDWIAEVEWLTGKKKFEGSESPGTLQYIEIRVEEADSQKVTLKSRQWHHQSVRSQKLLYINRKGEKEAKENMWHIFKRIL